MGTRHRKRRNSRKYRKRRCRFWIRTAMIFMMALLIILVGKNVLSVRKNPITESLVPLTAQEKKEVDDVISQAGGDGEILRELYENNRETVNFILHYPEEKDRGPAEEIGEFEEGQIPELLQWDERWGYEIYGDTMLAVNGCGPTSLAMVICGLTGRSDITPYKVAVFSQENGYYEGDAGTSWLLMTEGAEQYGIHAEELSIGENVAFSELENGHPVICSMKPGDFTTTGHFIVLTGVRDGQIQVNDPNSMIRSAQLWDYTTLEPQISNLWGYSLY